MYNFGTHNITLDIDYYKSECEKYLNSNDHKVTGSKGLNLFHKVPNSDKQELQKYVDNLTGIHNDWHFDYFHSGEPAGLHTDYDTVPWNETTSCQIIVGIIIPLDWNCKQPYTINYNKRSDVSRKLIYRQGEMRYKDTNEVVEYRTDWKYDSKVQLYNPVETAYAKEYADLKVHSVYKWELGTAMLFDTARWHSSSWFLNTSHLPEISTEWKRAIIGFGSIDVQRN